MRACNAVLRAYNGTMQACSAIARACNAAMWAHNAMLRTRPTALRARIIHIGDAGGAELMGRVWGSPPAAA
jgi:hypothetical protein